MVHNTVPVLVVGAGPAGLAAALELNRLGVEDVLVVDREPEVGGVPRLCHHTGFGLLDLHWLHTGPGYAKYYRRRVEASGIQVRTSTTVTGWAGTRTLALTSPGGLEQVTAQAVLLATGCRERPRAARLVPGGRPHGVFTAGSLQEFVYGQRLPVGRCAVVIGAELASFSALMTLTAAHTRVARMVTELPEHQAAGVYRAFKWYTADLLARVPVTPQARVTRILGHSRVEGVEIAHLALGTVETVACDTVVFTGDWIPENELARSGGAQIDLGTRGPTVDTSLRTSVPGVFAAGNLLRGAEMADVAALEGRYAARQVYDYLQHPLWPETTVPIKVEPPLVWVSPNRVARDRTLPPWRHFLFRISQFCSPARVEIRQGQRVVHQQMFTRLSPNLSAHLDAHWLANVELGQEPLVVCLADSSSCANPRQGPAN